MPDAAPLQAWDTITFDCYGTLVDWETGIANAFRDAGRTAGLDLDDSDVITAYAEIEPEVEAGPYRPYRDVLAETARRVAERLGWTLMGDRAAFLAESLPGWPVFPDTRPALRRLKTRFRLAILSNVDDDLLEATTRTIGVEFDFTVTAERVRSYKPRPAHFEEAIRTVGGTADRLLHAAQSYFHDIAPATRLGVATVWVNRKAEAPPAGSEPYHRLADLSQVADWLGV